jgi:hypothetical protein
MFAQEQNLNLVSMIGFCIEKVVYLILNFFILKFILCVDNLCFNLK